MQTQNYLIEQLPPLISTEKAMEITLTKRGKFETLAKKHRFRSNKDGRSRAWLTDDILKYIYKHCK